MSQDETHSQNASRSGSPEPEIQVDQSPPPRNANRPFKERRQNKQQQQVQNEFLSPPGEDPTRALTQPTRGQVGQRDDDQFGRTVGETINAPAPGTGPDKDTLKLRLDLNLDVDVQIKARVHGDVTLSLLD